MTEAGYLEPKRINPTGLTIVIALHAAAVTALVMTKMDVVPIKRPTTMVTFIPAPKEPPPKQKPAESHKTQQTVPLFVPKQIVDVAPTEVQFTSTVLPPQTIEPIWESVSNPPAKPDPVRIQAEFDQRFADRLKPPYPTPEQRDGVEGKVTVAVLIGVDGRVKAVEKIAATTDNFFRATEKQALSQWRFRPATLDGKPIESRKRLTLRFELNS